MEEIDALKINFEQDQLFLLNICLAFVMFGIALDLTKEDFLRLFRNPKPAFVGLSSQLILLPILTISIVMAWPMPASMALGLILVASCPGGNISNFAVHIGKGNTALSISLTSAVTILAAVLTPLTFQIWSRLIPKTNALLKDVSLDFYKMFESVALLILIPLIVGMSVRHFLPQIAAKIRKPINYLSLVIFAAIITVALYENISVMKDYLYMVFWIVLIHNGLALVMGYHWAQLWNLPVEDRKAISMETGIQNSGLGLILVFNFFDGLGGMMLITAWWGIWDMISGLTLAMIWKYRLRRKHEMA